MEFRHAAAFIAISILGVAFLSMIISVSVSYWKWNQVFNKMIKEKNGVTVEQPKQTGIAKTKEDLTVPKHNPSFVAEENLGHFQNSLMKNRDCCDNHYSASSPETPVKIKDRPVKPKPRKISATTNNKLGGEQNIKERIIQAVTKQRNSDKHNNNNNSSFDLDDINCSASTLV